jgi:hypothetical protein
MENEYNMDMDNFVSRMDVDKSDKDSLLVIILINTASWIL